MFIFVFVKMNDRFYVGRLYLKQLIAFFIS